MKKIIITLILTFASFQVMLKPMSSLTNKPIKAAGVLPITYHNNKILFLLGKERGGKHKGTWADFGGLIENNESPYQTARREFNQEAREVYKNILIPPDAGILHSQKYYMMYIVPVSYKSEAVFINSRKGDREKNDFVWVDAEQFVNQFEIYAKNRITEPDQLLFHLIVDDLHPSKRSIKIRPPFAQYFLNRETRALIKQKIQEFRNSTTGSQLPTTRPSPASSTTEPRVLSKASEPVQKKIAAVLPIAFHGGQVSFLLRKKHNGTWSNFSGESTMDFEKNAKRIFNEQTQEIYKNIEIKLDNLIYHPNNGANLFYKMFITQIPYKKIDINNLMWVNAEDFMQQVSKQNEDLIQQLIKKAEEFTGSQAYYEEFIKQLINNEKIMYYTYTRKHSTIQIDPLFAKFFVESEEIEEAIQSALSQPRTKGISECPIPSSSKPFESILFQGDSQNIGKQLLPQLSQLKQKLMDLRDLF